MADETERIILELEFDAKEAQAQSIKFKQSIVANEKALRDLRAETRKSGKATALQASELTRLEATVKKDKAAFNSLQKSIVTADKAQKASTKTIQGMRSRLSGLTAELNKTEIGTKRFKELQVETRQTSDQLKELEKSVGDNRREVGNYAGALEGLENQIGGVAGTVIKLVKDLFSSSVANKAVDVSAKSAAASTSTLGVAMTSTAVATTTAGATAKSTATSFSALGTSIKSALGPLILIAATVAAGKALFDLQQNLEETRKQVNLLTGATGDLLDTVTSKAQATSDAFGKDFNEVLRSANSLSKQLGIELPEALDLINKGFATGADINGEFLRTLMEYPVQFKAVGLSASQSIALIQQQTTEGIFSDKGIDSIKEAGIRLRELTPVTRDALDAIGLSSKEIEKSLADGSKTLFDIIQEVSKRLDKLPPQSVVVGTAIADIFGGAGEDAGLEYIKLLANINLSLDDVVKNGGAFVDTQLKLIEVNERLGLVLNQVLGAADGGFDNLKVTIGTLAADTLEFLLAQFIRAANFFIRLNNESIVFRAGLNLIGTLVKINFGAMFQALKQSIEGFRTLGKVAAAVFSGDFTDVAGILRQGFNAQISEIKQFGIDAANEFADAYEATVNPKLIEPIVLAQPEIEAASRDNGTVAGKAFATAQSEAQKKAAVLALKLQRELIDARIANLEDEQQKIEAIENARFDKEKARITAEFGITRQSKELIEELEKTHQFNLQQIRDEATELKKVKQIEDDLAALELRVINDENDLQAKIDLENLKREVTLENEELTANQRSVIIAKSEKTISSIRDKARIEQFKKDQQSINDLKGINQAFSGFVGALKDLELQQAGDDAEAKKKIEKDFADVEFIISIAQIATNTALAITTALAQLGPIAGAIAAVAIGITGGLQIEIARRNRNRIKSLGSGGISNSGEFKGPRHSAGGITYYGDDGNVVNVEGGEKWAVVNRKGSSIMNTLGMFNAMGGGPNFAQAENGGVFLQDGGVADRFVAQPIVSQATQTEELISAIRQLPRPVVFVEEINTGQQGVIEVIERSQV